MNWEKGDQVVFNGEVGVVQSKQVTSRSRVWVLMPSMGRIQITTNKLKRLSPAELKLIEAYEELMS